MFAQALSRALKKDTGTGDTEKGGEEGGVPKISKEMLFGFFESGIKKRIRMEERAKNEKRELEDIKQKLEAQTRQRAQYKHGAFNRIQLDPKEYKDTPSVAKA